MGLARSVTLRNYYARLGIAVLVALISCIFVSLYTEVCLSQYVQAQTILPRITMPLPLWRYCAFGVPVALLAVGIWIGKRPGLSLQAELLLGGAWVFAFLWFAYALLAWRVADTYMYVVVPRR